MHSQYLSLSFDIRLKWPPGLLSFFRWLRALTDGIDLAAPECVSGGWSYHLYVEILLIGIGCLFGAALVIHELARMGARAVKVRADDDPEGATCFGGLRGGNARAFTMLESLWQRGNGMKQFAVFTLNVAYIYITGVLLQAWDCFTTSDGVSSMRTDPKTVCTTKVHQRFKNFATALICIIGPGVPLGYAYFIRRLRADAKAAADANGRTTMRRRVWTGLSDPLTRTSWGGLYDMYCHCHDYSADDEAGGVDGLNAELPTTRRARFVHSFKKTRFRIRLSVSAYYECFIFVEKLLLVVAMHMLSSINAKAIAQAVVYAIYALLQMYLWPFQPRG